MAKLTLASDRSVSGILSQTRNYLRQDSGRYFLLAIIRILLVFIPQTGYVHKDEFFESFEDAAGDALGIDSARGWRLGSEGTPNRHVSFPLLMIGGPLIALKALSDCWRFLYTSSTGLVTPYTTLVAPRLFACLLSFMTDYHMGRLFTLIAPKSSSSGNQAARRLLLLASSGAMMIYATRTVTGVLEMSLYTALVYQVARAITPIRQKALAQNSDKTKTISVPPGDLATVVPVAMLVACGCYNRNGFALYASFPLLAWLLRSHSTGGNVEMRATSAALALAKRALSLALAAAPIFLLLSYLDAMYYGSPPLSSTLHKLALVNEPAVEEGEPKPPWKVIGNTLWIYNVLGIIAICRSVGVGLSLLLRRPYFTGRRLQAFLTWCSGGPLFVMTCMAPFGMVAKDGHFLLPILPLFILLNADVFESCDKTEQRCSDHHVAEFTKMTVEHVSSIRKRKLGLSKVLVRVWMLCNIVFIMYYGFLKDAGTYRLINRVHREISLGVFNWQMQKMSK